MARKCRLEFPGACYHVINRGNYRRDVFATAGAKSAFESCLFEACTKSAWLLHAFAVMRNHFHLMLETPQANLVTGMQWLESTYANRFNRFRDERGHLFQGRYKAIIVEPGPALGMVCDYIHLNPVRAHAAKVPALGELPATSYWYLQRPRVRPAFLRVTTALHEAGELPDTPAGRRAYADFLSWQLTDGPLSDPEIVRAFTTGWALGGTEFIEGLLRERDPSDEARAWEAGGAREVREARWKELLDQASECLGPETADPMRGRKSAPWKIAVATFLKTRTQVSNPWLSQQLHMGIPARVSLMVGQARRDPTRIQPWLAKLEAEMLP